ncbi:MAG: GSCFA domain-containing protein [Saprospiraceae bacterium]|nr:GSCFA domain-containing protein [Saprospiraceae bacterium]
MSAFRTTFPIEPYPFQLSHDKVILTLGSCFAQDMGDRMLQAKFRITVNPGGILYNPCSIAQTLQSYTESTHESIATSLVEHNGLWHSLQHHGSISANSKIELLRNIKRAHKSGANASEDAHLVICTLGSSFVFRLAESDQIVANCHKLPASTFKRSLLDPEEIYEALHRSFSQLRSVNPSVNFLLTVSPVRHLRDGLIENSRSKAQLNYVCHRLCSHMSRCYYFPAYELMLDDLRDYRYYQDDMIHPTLLAQKYIWNLFASACLSPESLSMMRDLDRLHKVLGHKPIHRGSAQHRIFVENVIRQLQEMKASHPDIDFLREDHMLIALEQS